MRRLVLGSLTLFALGRSALAQFSDGKIVIGVIGDQSGIVADVGGPGSILAARMAIADFGGSVDRVPVEIARRSASSLTHASGNPSLESSIGIGI
jgi:branched-chain amino acid transport system substrate-binding protein